MIRQFQQNDLDSTTKALTVEVSFVSAAHTVTYLVDGGTDGGGTITAESSGQKVESGQTVADGASVTFTAAPGGWQGREALDGGQQNLHLAGYDQPLP